jgi:hypothetical protein
MESVGKQGICVKFCFKAETHNMLRETYGDDALSQTTTYKWFKCFKNGRTSMDDDERSGRPSTSRSKPLIAQVEIICGNQQLTVRKVAEKSGISIGSRLLTDDLQNLQYFETCDRMWVYDYDTNPHTGRVLLSARPKKA